MRVHKGVLMHQVVTSSRFADAAGVQVPKVCPRLRRYPASRAPPVAARRSGYTYLHKNGYNPLEDENFDAAGDSVDEADWERASAILREGMPPLASHKPATPSKPSAYKMEPKKSVESPEPIYHSHPSPSTKKSNSTWFSSFLSKLHSAWLIFFPNVPKDTSTARDAGMNRLKVVLIADRVGMTAASFEEMKKSIIDALERYVEVANEGDVEVTVTQDQDIGAVYSVSVPVRRVKQEARYALMEGDGGNLLDADGVTVAWDENNWDSDPSARFPYGA